ncbi:MAG: AMP-binding protein, partial [Rhodospirillales bacterium]|nr:AMP-binding protein [Rhodospirillales bacterium]
PIVSKVAGSAHLNKEAVMDLAPPPSKKAIEKIHSERKPVAVEMARQSNLLKKRLSGVNIDKLDNPEEWRKIPLLTKDELRKLSTEEFYNDFCIASLDEASEYWRSGGSTGKPLFYPRSHEDLKYKLNIGFGRIWPCINATKSDRLHTSFPLGVHPIGQALPRSAAQQGLASLWAGAGTTTPTPVQLDLILDLKATIVGAMPSYALHLANVAKAEGIDLANSDVKKLIVSAEPLTDAKRAKLERIWGATVYNAMGMTEGSMMFSERDGVDGMIAWSDMFYLEVIDSESGDPVAEGEEGALVMTPLFCNNITPFLRWLTGDIVTLKSQPESDDPWSVFPVLHHALRTEGFFKVRGVNINHGDLEDFMFNHEEITDFKAEVITQDDKDLIRLLIELPRGTEPAALNTKLNDAFKKTFESSPEVVVLERGSLAKEFESSVKAPRFVDKR